MLFVLCVFLLISKRLDGFDRIAGGVWMHLYELRYGEIEIDGKCTINYTIVHVRIRTLTIHTNIGWEMREQRATNSIAADTIWIWYWPWIFLNCYYCTTVHTKLLLLLLHSHATELIHSTIGMSVSSCSRSSVYLLLLQTMKHSNPIQSFAVDFGLFCGISRKKMLWMWMSVRARLFPQKQKGEQNRVNNERCIQFHESFFVLFIFLTLCIKMLFIERLRFYYKAYHSYFPPIWFFLSIDCQFIFAIATICNQ